MAKHEKGPRCKMFNIASSGLCLFGTPNSKKYRHPFTVPAGAWYGRDSRGYWVYFNPFSEYRDQPSYIVWRFNDERRKWMRVEECGTPVARIIRHNLAGRSVKSAEMMNRLRMDKDDIKSLSKIPLSDKKYKNPRSMNKGYRHNVGLREKYSCAISLHPAEKMYTPLDYGNPMR